MPSKSGDYEDIILEETLLALAKDMREVFDFPIEDDPLVRYVKENPGKLPLEVAVKIAKKCYKKSLGDIFPSLAETPPLATSASVPEAQEPVSKCSSHDDHFNYKLIEYDHYFQKDRRYSKVGAQLVVNFIHCSCSPGMCLIFFCPTIHAMNQGKMPCMQKTLPNGRQQKRI